MRKKLWLLLPLVVASIALAQNTNVQGARGEGAARSEDGRIGQFRFEVAKSVRPNGEPIIQGAMRFQSEVPGNAEHLGRLILIEGRAARFAKAERVAEFGGPGVLVVKTRSETVRLEGRWSSRVVDNRGPLEARGTPDGFAIHFDVANSDRTYDFRGPVLRGDIVVYPRP